VNEKEEEQINIQNIRPNTWPLFKGKEEKKTSILLSFRLFCSVDNELLIFFSSSPQYSQANNDHNNVHI
jgi:hypothetical protein